MAVDANVIIFARIREEIAAGQVRKHSPLRLDLRKHFPQSVDGNITTLIAAAVLGLQVDPELSKDLLHTLALGIVFSMFTALVISRLAGESTVCTWLPG